MGHVAHFRDAALFKSRNNLNLEWIVAEGTAAGDPYAEETEWINVNHSGCSQNESHWELFQRGDARRRST